jgi:hypothetical protein
MPLFSSTLAFTFFSFFHILLSLSPLSLSLTYIFLSTPPNPFGRGFHVSSTTSVDTTGNAAADNA